MTVAAVIAYALGACGPESRPAVPALTPLATAEWRADHHVHLASADICDRAGECLDTHEPSAVFAADAVAALDQASIDRATVFSSAYLYGLTSLALEPEEAARLARDENEFTAKEAARYPDRLTAFLSVDPLEDWAAAELEFWQGNAVFAGLKLHLAASGVDVGRADDREQLNRVLRRAAAQDLPVVMHIGGAGFDADDARTFIDDVLPNAGESPVQVAHAGGGYPIVAGRQAAILRVFADRIEAGDPRMQNVYFDLAYVPAPEETEESVAAIVAEMRRIGMERLLFGSDFDVLAPAAQIEALERLGLTEDEMRLLRTNCAPWLCRPETADLQ